MHMHNFCYLSSMLTGRAARQAGRSYPPTPLVFLLALLASNRHDVDFAREPDESAQGQDQKDESTEKGINP